MTRETYGTGHVAAGEGGRVVAVETGSDAARAGIKIGDRVVSVDGEPVADVLDWQWLTSEPSFTVSVVRDGRATDIEVVREAGGMLGVDFADVVFDGVRECLNACAFCFVAQLPPGLRPSLYVRDDDFRLSFLNGTFVTLTNLADDDVERIVEQHLSPLYVSVHAVDPQVRRRLICPTVDDIALMRLDELLSAGIEVHVQIVLVPGVNDGDVLTETLDHLAGRAGVVSVGVVPLGYTGHQKRFSRSYEESAAAMSVLETGESWRAAHDDAVPGPWVQFADEFYINAGVSVPPAEAYGEFAHYENGIGMVRTFLDALAAKVPAGGLSHGVVAVTGTLFAPVLEQALTALGLSSHVTVLPVVNRLMGGGVSVTGLLGGKDIVDAISAFPSAGPFLVPDVVVNSDGLLLDDTPASALAGLTGKDVRIIAADAAALLRAVSHP